MDYNENTPAEDPPPYTEVAAPSEQSVNATESHAPPQGPPPSQPQRPARPPATPARPPPKSSALTGPALYPNEKQRPSARPPAGPPPGKSSSSAYKPPPGPPPSSSRPPPGPPPSHSSSEHHYHHHHHYQGDPYGYNNSPGPQYQQPPPMMGPPPGPPMGRPQLHYPAGYHCYRCNNTGIKIGKGTTCKDCFDKFGVRSTAQYIPSGMAPVFSGPPRVVPPGDPSIGGWLCGRCRGKGIVHELKIFENTCPVCHGVGRVF